MQPRRHCPSVHVTQCIHDVGLLAGRQAARHQPSVSHSTSLVALACKAQWSSVTLKLDLVTTYTPTLNLTNPAPACDLDYIREPDGRTAHVDYVVSNSFGFGGINACLVFGKV